MDGVNVDAFLDDLSELRFPHAFNPYSEKCAVHDVDEAPAIRRKNLEAILLAATTNGIDSLWIGRDLGYRGGRRTGLPLTDEAHLSSHAAIFGCTSLCRATKGPMVAERTATIIWRMLENIGRPVFLWNAFPLHPHEQGDPLSNRCHTRAERQACRSLLVWLLRTLNPRHVVAIGKDAQNALADLDIAAVGVRHPSYGGQAEFITGITTLYKLPKARRDYPQLSLSLS
ncbi:MAG: uracil-DNA glycosylase [Mesorhizobium sp.]|nr:MAG: uracil-DNA glycosylase [Mesorhizobium sp.]RWE43736.1 MAG: uracil-DNA glycosylase [Mesorhizobium sp.]